VSSIQRVILITGTSRGIGRYLAERYLGRGHRVEGCSRGEVDWEAPGYRHHQIDICDEKQVKSMVAEIRRTHDRLDVAINNAGIASLNHILLTPSSAVEKILAVNFRGTFLVCRESAKIMKRTGFGRIVNFGSVAVPLYLEGEAVYAASKSAVLTLTRIMAREVASFGITCNVVAPSPIDTDLIRGVPPEKIDALIDRLAVKRRATFEDVANVVDFFINPASSNVTGQVIYLGGVG